MQWSDNSLDLSPISNPWFIIKKNNQDCEVQEDGLGLLQVIKQQHARLHQVLKVIGNMTKYSSKCQEYNNEHRCGFFLQLVCPHHLIVCFTIQPLQIISCGLTDYIAGYNGKLSLK